MDQYDSLISRAQLLAAQDRYDLAEEELGKAIALDPDHGAAYSMLAHIKCVQGQNREATELAKRGIAMEPDNAYAHYTLAAVYYERDRYDEASTAVDSATELDPTDPDFHSLKSLIALQQYRWQDALESAEMGLQFDPDHKSCNNSRAIALTRLGRREEAGATIDSVLAKNPEDAVTHANSGWNKLHGGEPQQAAEHFKEALRLDPNNQWARSGIIESLKAKNIVYRQFLRYMLWVSRFPPKTQLFAFIGVIVVLQILVRMPSGSSLQTLGSFLALGYLAFVGSMWLASPLFDLLLRMSRYGRMVLTDERKADTTYLALALVAVAIFLSGPIVTQLRQQDVIYYAILLMPVAVCLNTSRRAKRKLTAIAVIAIFAVASVYWYRWYIDTGIEGLGSLREMLDFVKEVALRDGDDAVPSGDEESKLLQIAQYYRSQNRLNDFFLWPAVAMTWLSDYFNRVEK
ncbi:tetratricopeptide repeat protein [Roseiconus lacunae]|uniref:tetratricopeptide repeat protein n=1 Tax=Roseiconus lacunae TaxID=2605694 RepID=UPI0011F11ABD|nr:tetratricopeptide repeat protein [Roseiconus lacunae]